MEDERMCDWLLGRQDANGTCMMVSVCACMDVGSTIYDGIGNAIEKRVKVPNEFYSQFSLLSTQLVMPCRRPYLPLATTFPPPLLPFCLTLSLHPPPPFSLCSCR